MKIKLPSYITRKSQNKKKAKKPELTNSKIIYLIKFPSFFYFHFFIIKFPSYAKLAITLEFDLTRFYDVIIRNSFFNLVF